MQLRSFILFLFVLALITLGVGCIHTGNTKTISIKNNTNQVLYLYITDGDMRSGRVYDKPAEFLGELRPSDEVEDRKYAYLDYFLEVKNTENYTVYSRWIPSGRVDTRIDIPQTGLKR